MEYATLTSQNQITVPLKVRDKLALKPSDKLVFYENGGNVVVTKLKSIADFKGLLKNHKQKPSKKDEEQVWLDRYERYANQANK
jgi:antitoxin PrlF